MPRTISTTDGQMFQGEYWKFIEKNNHILFGVSPFSRVKINKSAISTDKTTSYLYEKFEIFGGTVIAAIIFGTILHFMYG